MAMGVDTAWNSNEDISLIFQYRKRPASAEYREALLVLDDVTYLHIQPCETGWDYTLYDVATMKQLDGGRLDGENMGRSEVIGNICETWGWAASPSSMHQFYD